MRANPGTRGIFRGLRAALSKQKLVQADTNPSAAEPAHAQEKIEVIPSTGPSRTQFLNVKNLGKEAVFHATGQIVSSENTNSVLTSVYPLGWGPNRDAWVAIQKGDTRQILIATIRDVSAGSLFHMALIQAGPSAERHWARWNAQEKLPLPRFGLKVSIIAEGTQDSWISYFSVAPEDEQGGGIRLTFRGHQVRTNLC